MKTAIFLIALFCLVVPVRAQEIQPGTRPDKTQRELLKRGYGMFIHYGMNTFLDKDWSEGVEPITQRNWTATNGYVSPGRQVSDMSYW